ncbi:MAG: Asp-tRNA(Asn)/Glu-tRNA(Gln) amidotransferase subunit GatC [Candidatus Methanomethylophilaceae archaeon]|jgi:aspartyl-tRNA(Asn)/glutamyl-tRNA(Gln) amidotransferase subunit C
MMEKDTLETVAHNAHLKLTEDETDKLHKEFTEVLNYFSLLDEVPVRKVTKLDPVGTAGNIRKDVPGSKIDSDEILKGIDTYDGYVRGPRL